MDVFLTVLLYVGGTILIIALLLWQSDIEAKAQAGSEARKAEKIWKKGILEEIARERRYKEMGYIEKYDLWRKNAKDAAIQTELKILEGNDKEIRERFTNDLVFGTAGLRGIMGAGTANLNIYTIARVTEGLAKYIKDSTKDNLFNIVKVVISYDTRNNSRLFADIARNVLEHFGISTYMFSEPHPVPLLSYAVRRLKADFGIMITASHNPKEYNGYKIYNRYGGQLADDASAEIAAYIDKASFFNDYAPAKPFEPIDREIQQQYRYDINKHFSRLSGFGKSGADIVYSSIHGSGLKHVPPLFDAFGIGYKVVEKQADFDGDFPTVKSPNPENKEALALAIEEAKKCGAEVVIATDPDADRMAAAVKGKDGEFICLDGNQTGVLMFDFLAEKYGGNNLAKAVLLKSFVSTNMINPIAAKYKTEIAEVGVGFKNQADKMLDLDKTGDKFFFFGFEESCGYLAHPFCRDKDGVSAALIFAALAREYKAHGKTPLDRLEELYKEHGYFVDKSVSTYYEGLDGFKTMQQIMERLFASVPESIGGKKVLVSRDYKAAHNSVYYELEGGNFVCARPSGTEPKLKYYIGATAKTRKEAQELFDKIKADMECLTKL